ncbi:DUF421 domain-containing protein [Bacillus glycinifermentans]|uniref:DUF421 domain-containing protein n=1 Tax=Bacillus glycinifermentans TaxID=1664069 RepID=UPI002DB9DD9E|nr:DUF421 domain-containing protein [Bacillus glycinifermentans]MEC0494923.1 DUF421 domain-containing protein [Bacillus glycinifermentans]MEC0540934.1 DUF421 domain-containing protein [Bacillus glycinifermentans]MEC3609266.1 DUF421 domain-containing protein [Bacillus glycinifermentans]
MDYLQLAVELIIGFAALFIMTKILGKTQFAQITPFDFISALILGEMVGNAIFDEDVTISKVLFAILVWGILIYSIEILSQKAQSMRGFLEGKPNIIIDKGKINYSALKKNKLDLNQVQTLAREKGCFSLHEIEYAILETDGSISVLRKHKYETPTKSELNIPYQPVQLPIAFILDGQLKEENLKEAGFDKSWLKQQLSSRNIQNYSDVLYAEWRGDEEKLYITQY